MIFYKLPAIEISRMIYERSRNMLDQEDLDDFKACNSATFLKKYLSSMKFLFTLAVVKTVRTSYLIII